MIDPRYILLTRILRTKAYLPFASDELNPLPISLAAWGEENEYIYHVLARLVPLGEALKT